LDSKIAKGCFQIIKIHPVEQAGSVFGTAQYGELHQHEGITEGKYRLAGAVQKKRSV
jgi:hypothetical protein